MPDATGREAAELRALAVEAYDALNARDLDRFMALLADDVEFTSLIAEAEGVSFRGREGVRTWWDTVVASFRDVHWEILEWITGPGMRVVVRSSGPSRAFPSSRPCGRPPARGKSG